MRIFEHVTEAARVMPHPVITIGNFDGVHLGHQAIAGCLAEAARRHRTGSLVLPFEPHPLQVLAPERCLPMIQTPRQKRELLASLGLDGFLPIPFTLEFARIEAEDFVRRILAGQLAIRALVIGENFTFGHRRQGNIALLRSLAAQTGFELITLTESGPEGQEVSSTRIRTLLGQGLLPEANRLLGRPYAVDGRVVGGLGLGTKLGFPTANIEPENRLLLPDGVHIASLELAGQQLEGVASLGFRPTITFGPGQQRSRVLEIHLFQNPGDIYGAAVRIHFHSTLRPELRFESRAELQIQIARDVQDAQAFFRKQAPANSVLSESRPSSLPGETNAG